MSSPALDRILALNTTWEREQALRMMPEHGRLILFEEWSRHDDLRAVDIVSLPFDLQAHFVSFVCGNPQKGITGSAQNFYVKPNPHWSAPESMNIDKEIQDKMRACVNLENGTRHNKRQWVHIEKATALSADKGVQAMSLFGPNAEFPQDRNRLIEITALEYALETASKGPQKEKAGETALALAEKKAEQAKKELAKLRREMTLLKNKQKKTSATQKESK